MPNTLLSSDRASSKTLVTGVLVLILTLYFFGRVIEVLPFSTPSTPFVALEILSAFAFALVHGARQYSLRGILIFVAVCLVIGNLLENLGVATGCPYGHYVFLSLMGPKLFHVPILLGLAYIGMAYVSWTLACLILRVSRIVLSSRQIILVPLLASVIMTSWDFAQDPVWSTLLHAWRWFDGGLWFGVPLTNYAGWILTVFLIYFCFALYLRRATTTPSAPADPRFAIALYALCALGNVLQLFRRQSQSIVADPTGTTWHTSAILHASAFVSIFIMGLFALLAGFGHRNPPAQTGIEPGSSLSELKIQR